MNTPTCQEFFEGVTCELESTVGPNAHSCDQVAEVAPELADGGGSGSVPVPGDDE